MKVHILKTVEPYYTDFAEGRKDFEIRENDRSYEVDDYLILARYIADEGGEIFLNGQYEVTRIKYITAYEQKEGFVVLGTDKSEVFYPEVLRYFVEQEIKNINEGIF